MVNELRLDIPSMNLMEYISVIESIYITEPTPIDNINTKGILTENETERIKNIPFGFTLCMQIFAERYNNNSFIKQFTYEEYIKHKDIQQLIQYFELDVDKFWLLTLFIFDYCSSLLYQGKTLKLTGLEQLQQLINIIDMAEGEMTINLKADKLKAKIDSPDAIRFMAAAIIEYAKNSDVNTLRELNKKTIEEKATITNASPFIAYFGKMFLYFLSSQPQVRAKRKKGANHSLKEMELVSLLVYFTKLSREAGWYCPEEKYLKSFLKQYKNYKYPNNISNIYPEFYL